VLFFRIDRLQLVPFGAHAELREAVFLEVGIAERIAREAGLKVKGK
jgi:hypothetical protein